MNKKDERIAELEKRIAELEQKPVAKRWGRIFISGKEKKVVNIKKIGGFEKKYKWLPSVPVLEYEDE